MSSDDVKKIIKTKLSNKIELSMNQLVGPDFLNGIDLKKTVLNSILSGNSVVERNLINAFHQGIYDYLKYCVESKTVPSGNGLRMKILEFMKNPESSGGSRKKTKKHVRFVNSKKRRSTTHKKNVRKIKSNKSRTHRK